MSIHHPRENLLLARLPPTLRRRLAERMQLVKLDFKQVLYRQRSPIDFVYFPISGALSAIMVMMDGRAIEVATIGNEGMVGISAVVSNKESANEVIVQIAG